MVQVVLHSIFHRDKYWIGLFSPQDPAINEKLLQNVQSLQNLQMLVAAQGAKKHYNYQKYLSQGYLL
jgi:hypothetical protein